MRRHIDLVNRLLETFDPDQFFQRLRGVMELARRGATEGERAAAKTAIERLKQRAKAEVARMREPDSGVTHKQVDRFLGILQQINDNTEPRPSAGRSQRRRDEPPAKPTPRFKVNQWVQQTVDDYIGKIVEIVTHHPTQVYYRVHSLEGGYETVSERNLRPVSQEEVDAAQIRYRAKYKDGDYVLAHGRLAQVTSVGWDRGTKSRWYEVDFVDGAGGSDLIEERDLQPAEPDDIDAEKTRSKGKSQSKSTGSGGFNIMMMARYVNAAQKSNKVYGVIQKLDTGRVYTFWGGWQKPLKVKYYPLEDDAHQQFNLKLRKGYAEISPGTDTEEWVIRALKTEFSRIGEARLHFLAVLTDKSGRRARS